AGGLLGARVHLQRTSARRQDDAVGARARALDGGVAAATVDYDHFGAERPQIGKRIERRGDAFAFVQHGHDDRELRHGAPVSSACGVSANLAAGWNAGSSATTLNRGQVPARLKRRWRVASWPGHAWWPLFATRARRHGDSRVSRAGSSDLKRA